MLKIVGPFAISIAAWAFALAILPRASGMDLEGDYYLTSFVGVISFVVVGPLTGALLSPYVHNKKMSFKTFLALLFFISLPVLSFQIMAYSSSILPGFMLGGPWTDHNMTPFYIQAVALAFFVYFAYAAFLYNQAKFSVGRAWITAILLCAASLGVIAFRVLHS